MNKLNKTIFLLCYLLFSSSTIFAETANSNSPLQQVISGVITDSQGVPLPDASINLKSNPMVGTSSDFNGKFSLKAKIPTTIIVSFVGFKTKEIKVTNSNFLKIILEDDSSFLDDIVVTARKRVENVQDIPIAITAIPSKTISEKGATDITAIANVAPNVSFSTAGTVSGSSSSAVVFMRGIGQNDYTPVVDPGVGIYVDEVYLGRTIGSVLDIVDLKSIEIIRGPQGTLFGRNSIGGAISLTSMDPTDKFAGSLSYTDGSYGRNDVSISLRGPVSKSLGMTFNFIRRNRDGYVERVNLRNSFLGDENMHGFKVKLKYGSDDDKFNLTFISDYIIEREESAPEQNLYFRGGAGDKGVPPIVAVWNKANPTKKYSDLNTTRAPFKTGETSLSQNDIDAYGSSLNMSYDLTESLESKLILSYRKVYAEFARQVDGSAYNIFENRDRYIQNQYSADLRLTSDTEKLDIIGGLFFFQENVDNRTRFTGALQGKAWPAQTGGDVKNTNYAAYLEGTYALTEQLSLTTGGRYTYEIKEARPNAFVDPSGSITSMNEPNAIRSATNGRRLIDKIWQENTFGQFTWRGILAYKASDFANLYSSVSTGFKSGGFAWRITNPTFYKAKENDYDGDGDGDLPSFAPEKVISYEVGTKFNFPETGIRLNLAGFYSDYKDLQIAVNTGIATFQKNAGDAIIKGLEAELTLNPFTGLTTNLSYGYTDAKYASLLKGAAVSKEDKFILTPKHALSGNISYKFTLPKELGYITPSFGGNYKSETHFEAVNSKYVFQKGYTALNASLKYNALENWQIIFGVENLTNELYLIGGDTNGAIGYENGIYARPRNYFGTITYSF